MSSTTFNPQLRQASNDSDDEWEDLGAESIAADAQNIANLQLKKADTAAAQTLSSTGDDVADWELFSRKSVVRSMRYDSRGVERSMRRQSAKQLKSQATQLQEFITATQQVNNSKTDMSQVKAVRAKFVKKSSFEESLNVIINRLGNVSLSARPLREEDLPLPDEASAPSSPIHSEAVQIAKKLEEEMNKTSKKERKQLATQLKTPKKRVEEKELKEMEDLHLQTCLRLLANTCHVNCLHAGFSHRKVQPSKRTGQAISRHHITPYTRKQPRSKE